MISSLELEYLKFYLDEYYSFLSDENKVIGDFIYSETIPSAEILDVGCGPSFLYWAGFHPFAKKITGLDIKEDSVAFVNHEISEIKLGKIHPRYLEVLDYVKSKSNQTDFVNQVNHFNVLQADLSTEWDIENDSVDLVISIFGLDCLDSKEQFDFCLSQAFRVLRNNGKLIVITLCDTDVWHCGDAIIKCLNVNSSFLNKSLERAGFKNPKILEAAAVTAIEKKQGYDKMLLCSVIKE